MNNKELVKLAFEAMQNSYSPYSKCKVGAALLAKSGKVYLGCNVENSSFSPTNCAERTAFFSAICAGEREFTKIAIVGGKDGQVTAMFMPCGVCRQVMSEFCDDDFEVVVAKGYDDFKSFTLKELLPYGFSKKNVKDDL